MSLASRKWGEPVPDDEPWTHLDGYMRWFYCVSHPLIVSPAPVLEYVVPIPVYQEILVE